ncbi:PREDICTED: aspartyl protease family protein 1-like [Tarenaya hassleriana]|uniref:aspartyl protease family protein 1-like n=1 Tax=Tarenaya hassleriana TaxID=28532 RepID=UPI00053C4D15|nr:PREDICTED: aspartyl protease family protein 1-like [Tarenaya hassleriana]
MGKENAGHVFVLMSLMMALWGCEASGKFGFDVHHVFSEPIQQMLGFDGLLPEKGSLDYFKVLAHRDRLIRGRGLISSSNNVQTPLTFIRGNRTLELDALGFLHYANVSVGTPATWFLVALDTGSDLFWLPCNCGTTCINNLNDTRLTQRSQPLNLYSPNASSTSSRVACGDARCFQEELCPSAGSTCPYQIEYLSANTSSRGTLFQDVLHLVTEDENLKPVEANITLGCGQVQTGAFSRRAAVNGLFGLGLENYSVPSMLAKAAITSNSFSMCFGNIVSILGRISFGDKGHSDQLETPLLHVRPSPTYVVNVTGIEVGGNAINVQLFALVDSGTSFTQLLQPAYDAVTKAFNALVTDKRLPVDPSFPFEFCYELSPNATTIVFPAVDLTMLGGSALRLRNPLFVSEFQNGSAIYCLGIVKSVDFKINIIGQNFMSGYRVVFDRERMVLGWKESDCFGDEGLTTSPAPPPSETAAPPPRVSVADMQPPTPSSSPRPPPPTNSSASSRTGSASDRLSPLPSPLFLLLLLPVMAFL